MVSRAEADEDVAESPFERFDLDPSEGIAAITQRLKELAEDARDDAERERIRQAWEELTLHPARRLRAALFTHPETRAPLGSPPPLARRRQVEPPRALGLRELAARPSALAAIAAAVASSSSGRTARGEEPSVPPLDEDPVLGRRL
jgi:hypothetical protein